MTTDKPDLCPTAPAYAPPQPGTAAGPPTGPGPRRAPLRVLPNVLWTLAALVLVPAGLGLLVWGAGERYVRLLQLQEEQAVVPTVSVVAGLLLLVVVAVLGAWAPLAPIVSGLLWGVVPGVVLLVDPLLIYRGAAIDDLRVQQHLSTSAALGVPLVVGLLLVAAGFAAALARRSGWRAVARS